jgi:hypothetical protein
VTDHVCRRWQRGDITLTVGNTTLTVAWGIMVG